MAWNLSSSSSPLHTVTPWLHAADNLQIKNHNTNILANNKLSSSIKFLSLCKAARSEEVTQEAASVATGTSARTQLDLLEKLRSSNPSTGGYQSDTDIPGLTIREQLSEIVGDRDDDFSIPLGKKLKASQYMLTISQKRNIKRQSYLNEVSRRNDSVFFATIGAFVILPPLVILSIAILTGYVQLFP